jgi:ABC-type transporter Mla MlaB component
MWKVKRAEAQDQIVLSLSGRLEGEHLNELQSVISLESADQKLVLDLRDIRLVDQDAVSFLDKCEAGGAILRNCPTYIRNWIAQYRSKDVLTQEQCK